MKEILLAMRAFYSTHDVIFESCECLLDADWPTD